MSSSSGEARGGDHGNTNAMQAGSGSADAASSLCEHVRRAGLDSHLFSDITLSFDNKEYKLHRIILSQSSYFKSLFSEPWKEHGKPRVELHIDDHNVTVEGIEASIAYMYGVTPSFTATNVIGILAAGCFLCMENLCKQCVDFMVHDLREETFVSYQQLSEHHCYGHSADRIRDACWTFLCSHGARELLHVLPKLSLQLLCRLLKSDELWVLNESERYRLAKTALLSWKQARNPAFDGGSSKKSKALKACCGRKHSSRTRKSKSKKKDVLVAAPAAEHPQKVVKEEVVQESALRKLQRLWEEDPGDQNEDFNVVVDVFTGGGVIFAYMNAYEALEARKELEDANLPTDAVNDGIWHHVLLKARIKDSEELESASSSSESSSSSSEEEDASEEEEEEEEASEEDDEEEVDDHDHDDDSSGEEWGMTDDSSEMIPDAAGTASSGSSVGGKRSNTTIIFGSSEAAPFDGKRRKTSGGFSWAVQLDSDMQLADFPPFRFGAEFPMTATVSPTTTDSEYVFYAGSAWRIIVSGCRQKVYISVQCRRLHGLGLEGVTYEDNRKRVNYSAKVFVKTKSGLQSVSGTGSRGAGRRASMILHERELANDQTLRVAAVLQLL